MPVQKTYLLWVKPTPDGLHEAGTVTSDRSQTYALNQDVVRDLISVIEDRGLILVSEKTKFPFIP